MKIRIVNFGRGKVAGIASAIEEFSSRLSRLVPFERTTIDTSKFSALPPEERKRRESQRAKEVFEGIKPLVILDGSGRKESTEELVRRFDTWERSGSASMVFGIGGAHGWEKEIVERADFVLSLSPLTFTSQLAELVLVEQLYRVHTLKRGMPYHKE